MVIQAYKKPIPIEALQWTGTNEAECKAFVGKDIEFIYPTLDNSVVFCVIHTLEGDMNATIGDYIIRGVDGEFYPCKEAIFEKTYERL